MLPLQDQLSAATRNHVESQYALFAATTAKAFEGMGKLYRLNFAAAKASVDESREAMQQLMGAKDISELIAMSVSQTQPNLQKVLAYSRHVANIASEVQSEVMQAAEMRLGEAGKNAAQLIDDLAKNAPAGSEAAVELVRTAVQTASTSYEQLARNTRLAVGAVGNTIDAATGTAAQEPAPTIIVAQ